MEVSKMEDTIESHTTSAAAFVEGGIQEACHDACSICLEDFCESDPAMITNCKHEFHLQCILEWCQRSSQCPMCWQSISLKDVTSQELLEAVVWERSLRNTPSRNAAIFRHPALGGFELQHLSAGGNDADFKEQMIQHLAAATAMRRARHFSRREGHRTRTPSTPLTSDGDAPAPLQLQRIPHFQAQSSSSLAPGSIVLATNREGIHSNDRGSSTANQDRVGPSEIQSFSDSLLSKFNTMSQRYKESISKGTRGWKERLFLRNSSMSELGSEVKRELNAGIAGVSRLMERLENRENHRGGGASLSNHLEDSSMAGTSNRHNVEPLQRNSLCDRNTVASFSARSDSN